MLATLLPGNCDPRLYQIGALSSLLLFGLIALDLEIRLAPALVILATALATQYGLGRWRNLARFDARSPLISALSLCLLLRTDSLALAAAAALLAISSKFLIRWRGKHVFNPANFGIVSLLLVTDGAWVSPGQWGSLAVLAFGILCLGILVLNRARRSETTITFLVVYVALVLGRALWLGDPLAIALHQLQSGALLIFAFFMISDPKTTPDSRLGRVLYALLVALGAFLVQFALYEPNGAIWTLFVAAPLVPLLDSLLEGRRYRWERAARREPEPLQYLETEGSS